MQLKWRHQDIYYKQENKRMSHKILWKVVLTGGIINGFIINNTSSRPVALIKNFSGKNVHNLQIHVEMFNILKLTKNGDFSATPDGIVGNRYHRYNKYHTSMAVSLCITNCGTYTLKDTDGDKESSTPVISNGFLFSIFNSNFSKQPGNYKFNLSFYCTRNNTSKNISIVYKYDNNINKCGVIKASKE